MRVPSPWNIPCDANDLRGRLKHSWLENEVLQYRSDNVVNRRRDGSWKRDGRIAAHEDRIADLMELADGLVDGFSPAGLVDRLEPLEALAPEAREMVKAAVHQAYAERHGMEELAVSLKAEAEYFRQSFVSFKKAWEDGDDAALEDAWDQVLQQAQALVAVLEKLPRGVVLP